MAPEWKDRIFDPFVQADGSATRSHGGTGLGLSICSRLVGFMGGRIWLDSEVGQGSVFHFTASFGIPAAYDVRDCAAGSEVLHGLRVLVADDNATNRRILYETMLGWRMKPVLADSTAAALHILRQSAGSGDPFDVVLLDAHMPGVGGLTLAGLAGSQIMMLSALDIHIKAAEALVPGHHLVKPVTRAQLLSAILKVRGLEQQRSIPSASILPASPSHSLHVLLAEDNIINQKVVMRLLEKQGHSVEVTANGTEALAAMARSTFDLILMDVQMPVMNGYDATQLIRQGERGTDRHIPIVALTAHAMKGDREVCLNAGMDDYLAKPIHPRELASVMERCIRSRAPEFQTT
ncbi:PAS domain S-box (fragment) [Candidatus Sulfopaludibacter sp. SbA3]